MGRIAVNSVVHEEQNFNENEECLQMSQELASTTLDNDHTYKRIDTDFAYEPNVMSCAIRSVITKR